VVVRRAEGTEGMAYVTVEEESVPEMPHTGCTTVPPTVAAEKEQAGVTTVVVRDDPEVAKVHTGCTKRPGAVPEENEATEHFDVQAESAPTVKVLGPKVEHAYAPFATSDFTSVMPVHTDKVMVVVDQGASKKRRGCVAVIVPIPEAVHTAGAPFAAETAIGA